MPGDTPMERLEAMAVDREVEAETIRGNKFRSHAYALEHEMAASDLRWALSEITRLQIENAQLQRLLDVTITTVRGDPMADAQKKWREERPAASARSEGANDG